MTSYRQNLWNNVLDLIWTMNFPLCRLFLERIERNHAPLALFLFTIEETNENS